MNESRIRGTNNNVALGLPFTLLQVRKLFIFHLMLKTCLSMPYYQSLMFFSISLEIYVEAFYFKATDNLFGHLQEITGGGADVVIDAVGLDAEKTLLEKVETLLKLQGGGLGTFRMAAKLFHKGGTIQVTGVYGMNYNAFPSGDLFARNITLKMGQAPVIHYMPELYRQIKKCVFDPTDIISHRIGLSEAEHGYKIFNNKEDNADYFEAVTLFPGIFVRVRT